MDNRFLDEDLVAQICFVTHDLEKSARWFSDLTGKPMPPLMKAAEPEVAKAVYHGEPAKVGCDIYMFDFANIMVEFIQPGPEKSVWRDLLEEKGPGCHHIAFKTRNLTRSNAYLESKGHPNIQSGEFGDGEITGRYAYYDTTKELGVLIELLELDNNKEPQ